MAQTFARKLLLAKLEGVEGADAAPTPVADAVLTSGLTLTPVTGDRTERNLDGASVGNDLVRLINKRMQLRFSVEISPIDLTLADVTKAAKAPGVATMLKVCGMSETLTKNAVNNGAGAAAAYAPRSSGVPSATLWFYTGNDLFKFVACRGTWGLTIPGSGYPTYQFDMQGTVAVPSHVEDAAFPAGTFAAFPDPIITSKKNTPVATLDGQAIILREFTYSHALQLVSVDVPNFSGTRIPDRSPTAAVTFEEGLLTHKNWFDIAASATPQKVLAIQQGLTANANVQIGMPAAQLMEDITEVDLQGVKGLRVNLNPIATPAGDDEIALMYRSPGA